MPRCRCFRARRTCCARRAKKKRAAEAAPRFSRRGSGADFQPAAASAARAIPPSSDVKLMATDAVLLDCREFLVKHHLANDCSEPDVGQSSFSSTEEKLEKALICMESALQLLDDADAPADIGAHLDMSMCRLKDVLSELAPDLPRAGSRPSGAN